jgi:hypothetical protein
LIPSGITPKQKVNNMAALGALAAEVGLGIVFTAIAFAPSVPSWLQAANDGGIHSNVEIGVGIPWTDPSQMGSDNDAAKQQLYKDLGFGGDAPNIALFDAEGNRIGVYQANGAKINQEDQPSFPITSFDKSNDAEPDYLTLSTSGTDNICIDHVSVVHGNAKMAFVPGEIAKVCNNATGKDYPWYPSGAKMTVSTQGNDYDYFPACLFLGGDPHAPAGDAPYEGLQIHLSDFHIDNSTMRAWNNDPTQMCASLSRFAMYKHMNEMTCPQVFAPPQPGGAMLPIKEVSACHPDVWHTSPINDPALTTAQADAIYNLFGYMRAPTTNPECPLNHGKPQGICVHNPPKRSVGNLLRSLGNTIWPTKRIPKPERKRSQFHQKLVRSSITQHSAIEVCTDPATRGPDFYSETEGMLCEMTTHKLYPACSDEYKTDCFDTTKNVIRRAGKIRARYEFSGYTHIAKW